MNCVNKQASKSLAIETINKRIKNWGIKKSSIEAKELEVQVLGWLENFTEDEQIVAISIIDRIEYFSKKRAHIAIKWIAQSIKKVLGSNYVGANIFLIGETAGSSGSHFLYDLLQELQLPKSRAPSSISQVLLDSDEPLIFIDDIIGSGNQAASFFDKHLKIRLDSKKPTIYAAIVACNSGIQHMKSKFNDLVILPYQLLNDEDKAFHETSKLFPDPTVREKVRNLSQKYGRLLYPLHELGYEDGQLLLTFEWNTPNNTIPIVWAGPNSESAIDKRWTPLFSRHKVSQSKYSAPLISKPKQIILRKNSSYYNALPFSNLHVDELYVNPNHTLYWIGTGWQVTQQPSDDFCEAVKQSIAAEKLVLLYGPYGSGKTFLAKYLDFHGILGSKDLVFTTQTHALLQKIKRSPGSYVEEILPESCQGIVIDALDVLLVDDEDHSQDLQLVAKFINTALERGINTLLTIRQSDALEYESPIIRELANYLLESGVLQIPAIKINRFEKGQIDLWLENFGNGKNPGEVLTSQKIKQTHKRLLKATENPLFLYILADAFRGDIENISTIYSIYESFISSTISGRFQSEKSTLPPSNTWKYADKYKYLLEMIAKEIARTTRIGKSKDFGGHQAVPLQIEQDDSIQDELLDSNTVTHSISEEHLSSILPSELRDMTTELPEIRGTAKIQILNNYFFSRLDRQIGFRDNNILFFLIAQQLFRAIEEIANNPYSPGIDNLLFSIADIKAHPQAIEILIRKIKKLADDRRSSICEAIEALINESKIIQLTGRSLDQLSGSSINRDLILSIVLLQIKRTSYSRTPYFISRLSWLTNAIKNQDNAYRLLVARFFRNLELNDIEFRRINCDDFNFQDSKLSNAKFIQTKLFDSTFRGCVFYNSEFTLCDFGDKTAPIIFNGISSSNDGVLKFSFCKGGALYFGDLAGRTRIYITNCQIGKLVFSSPSKAERYSLELHILNSIIESISFDKIYIKSGSAIENSIIHKINDKGSGGKFHTSTASAPVLQKIREGSGSIKFTDVRNELEDD